MTKANESIGGKAGETQIVDAVLKGLAKGYPKCCVEFYVHCLATGVDPYEHGANVEPDWDLLACPVCVALRDTVFDNSRMKILPREGITKESAVAQATLISKAFGETVQLGLPEGVTIISTQDDVVVDDVEAPVLDALAKWKQGVTSQADSMHLMAETIRVVCPAYISFQMTDWNETGVTETWAVEFQVGGKTARGIQVGFSKALPYPYIGPDAAPLTRDTLDYCLHERLG